MSNAAVRELARTRGVSLRYRDVTGMQRTASVETLIGVLRALGLPIDRAGEAPALLAATSECASPVLPSVVVAQADAPAELTLHLPDGAPAGGTVDITTEAGETFGCRLLEIEPHLGPSVPVRLPIRLPAGYHQARIEVGRASAEALLVVAPWKAPDPEPRRSWGVFAPMYGLWSGDGRAADYGAFGRLAEWTSACGGSVVATLPLLATFLDQPYDPSPYRPVSRRWWNEVYVDCTRLPELSGEAMVDVPVDAGGYVDLPALMARKRPLLARAAERLEHAGGRRRSELDEFVRARPEVVEYARFRAGFEPGNESLNTRYHVYAQFVTEQQVAGLASDLRARSQSLYLDLPLGTHPAGFDVHHEPEAFATGASVGAPPDEFFHRGQNWGFPPPHPDGMRRTGYRDLRATLAHHLRYAGMLRIDHVMGLHRLWWVPDGAAPDEGAYVQYPAEQLYAVACLEADRHGAALAGENLGTVPREVDRALARHNLRSTFVGQFAMDTTKAPVMARPPHRSVAGLNTHDIATFAGFWSGADVDDRLRHGVATEREASREKRGRAELRAALVRDLASRGLLPDRIVAELETDEVCRMVLGALLAELGASDADVVLVSVEDLALERYQQNLPGTTGDVRANFRRRPARSLEDLGAPAIAATLGRLDHARRKEVPA